MRLASSIAAIVLMVVSMSSAQALSPYCDPDFFGCMAEFEPVCGHDGKSHQNFNSHCDLEVAKCKNPSLKQLYACECNNEGRCEGDPEPPSPPANQDGCHGVVACPMDFDPVCFKLSSGDSVQFSNHCEFKRAKCGNTLLSSAVACDCNDQGKCAAAPASKPKCSVPKFKICASNSKTYEDAKAFLAARLLNPTIKFASIGECGAPPLAPPFVPQADSGDACGIVCTAPNLYKPVCTPKGAIFQHRCFHLQAFCCDGESYPDARVEFCNPLLLP